MTSDQKESSRQFGWLFLFIFCGLTSWYYYTDKLHLFQIFSLISILFFLVTLIKPILLWPFYKAWMFIGHILGVINSKIIFGILFFLIFTPIAIWFRLIRRDLLNLKPKKNVETYWKSPDRSFSQLFESQF